VDFYGSTSNKSTGANGAGEGANGSEGAHMAKRRRKCLREEGGAYARGGGTHT
jgi:hypothetical protein